MPNNDDFSALCCHYDYRKLNATSLITVRTTVTMLVILASVTMG